MNIRQLNTVNKIQRGERKKNKEEDDIGILNYNSMQVAKDVCTEKQLKTVRAVCTYIFKCAHRSIRE